MWLGPSLGVTNRRWEGPDTQQMCSLLLYQTADKRTSMSHYWFKHRYFLFMFGKRNGVARSQMTYKYDWLFFKDLTISSFKYVQLSAQTWIDYSTFISSEKLWKGNSPWECKWSEECMLMIFCLVLHSFSSWSNGCETRGRIHNRSPSITHQVKLPH